MYNNYVYTNVYVSFPRLLAFLNCTYNQIMSYIHVYVIITFTSYAVKYKGVAFGFHLEDVFEDFFVDLKMEF